MSTPDQDEVIEEFLGDQPRAETWRELRQALQDRLKDAVSSRDESASDDPRRPSLEARVDELRQQVTALAEEEAITQFVEESVRASLTRPASPGSGGTAYDGGIDDDDEGYY